MCIRDSAYACPNTVSNAERLKKDYNNIFNFVNPQDFVTKVVPSVWRFGRYGTTYVFPSSICGFEKLNHDYFDSAAYETVSYTHLNCMYVVIFGNYRNKQMKKKVLHHQIITRWYLMERRNRQYHLQKQENLGFKMLR